MYNVAVWFNTVAFI